MIICFRLDANSFIGLGHLKRCLQLASDLKKKINNSQIFFIMKKNKENNELILKKKGFKVFLITNSSDDFKQTKRIIKKTNCHCLILDHYYLGINWEKKIKNQVQKFFIISDHFRKHSGDLLIVQNFTTEIKRNNIVSGKKFFLISKEYRRERKKIKKITKKKIILINFGSYDINNLTCKSVVFFLKNFNDIKINVVIGKDFKYMKQLKDLKKINKNLQFFVSLNSLANITNKASICIGSGGIHNYERLFLGKLSFVIRTDLNQKKNIEFLKKKKFITYLGTHKNFSLNKINKNFFKMKYLINNQRKLFKFFPNKNEQNLSNLLKQKIYE